MSIAENVALVQSQIASAARAVGRAPSEITLCAATKMNDADRVRQAIAAGIACCGENKVQELLEKHAANAYCGAQVDFIGHLQTNKVKSVVGNVRLIHSVDSERLLAAINAEAQKRGLVQEILLEINIGQEQSKSGFSPCELSPLLEKAGAYAHVRIRGLMAIPPICRISDGNHKFFTEIRNLSVDIAAKKYDNVSMEILSMGMSDDFADAIACGSTMIRIGTAIFGARDYAHPSRMHPTKEDGT